MSGTHTRRRRGLPRVRIEYPGPAVIAPWGENPEERERFYRERWEQDRAAHRTAGRT